MLGDAGDRQPITTLEISSAVRAIGAYSGMLESVFLGHRRTTSYDQDPALEDTPDWARERVCMWHLAARVGAALQHERVVARR